jgi:hypothetical protein
MTGSNLTLWHSEPAEDRIRALSVGNGRLGATVYGSLQNERLRICRGRIHAVDSSVACSQPR